MVVYVSYVTNTRLFRGETINDVQHDYQLSYQK
jgi:hypothetical protein